MEWSIHTICYTPIFGHGAEYTLYITRPSLPPLKPFSIYSVKHILTLWWFMSHLGPLSNVRGQGGRGTNIFGPNLFVPTKIIYKCWSQRRGANMDNTTWRSYFQAGTLPPCCRWLSLLQLVYSVLALAASDVEPFSSAAQSLARAALSAVSYDVCSNISVSAAVPAVP